MTSRKEKVIKLITDNPSKSGNKLYQESVNKGFGINKSEFYRTLRIIRKLPEPSLEVKRKAIPIKYRKPGIVVLKPPKPKKEKIQITLDEIIGVKKEGSYKVVEVEMDGTFYYIKYKTRKQFNKHLKKLKESYKPKKITFRFLGIRFYEQYRTDEFIKLLAKSGL